MNAAPPSLRLHEARVFILLIVALAMTGYLLTYRGQYRKRRYACARWMRLTSLSRFGDTLMDESTWFKPPQRIRANRDGLAAKCTSM